MEELKCSNCGSFNGTLVSDTQNRLLCNKCNTLSYLEEGIKLDGTKVLTYKIRQELQEEFPKYSEEQILDIVVESLIEMEEGKKYE